MVFGVLGDGEGAEGIVDLGCHWVVAGEVGGEVVDVVLGRVSIFSVSGLCSVRKGQSSG